MSKVSLKVTTTALDTLQELLVDELRRVVQAAHEVDANWPALHDRLEHLLTTAEYVFDELVVETLRRNFTMPPR
jgi:hypothetical protein